MIMKLSFQVIDCDYILLNNRPVVRLFGKTDAGKTVCAFHENYLPYFYILPKEGEWEKVTSFLQKKFTNLLVRADEVERFLPIGFHEDKKKLLKVILNDPSQVPTIRDELKAQEAVKETYEADILFKYRFMADFDISGMKWVEAEGEPITTSTVKTDITIKARAIKTVEKDANVGFKYMAVDIEIVSGKERLPDPQKDQISMISLSFFPSHKNHKTLVLLTKQTKKSYSDVIILKNEKEMLEEFLKIVDSFDPDFIVGYNINDFDLPWILERLRINRITRAIGRCRSKQAVSRKIGIRYKNSITGRVIADVYELVKESVGKGLLRLKRYGLGDVSKELINEDKIDISHSEIGKYWNGNEENLKKLIDYSRKDAELALTLLFKRNMLDKFIEISKVSGILLQDSLSISESIRIENLLLKEFNKRGFVIPNKPDDFEVRRRDEERKTRELTGALVLEPKKGLHDKCVVYLDFRSLYPSIYHAFNICPTTLLLEKQDTAKIETPYGTQFVSTDIRKGIIPQIVYNLVETRDRIKKQMGAEINPEKKRELNAKQIGLKYIANAFYGYTGYVRARFYVLDIANGITSCGRDILTKTKELIEGKTKFKVIYGDTDSFCINADTTDLEEAQRIGQEIVNLVNNQFKGTIKVKIEAIFKTLLILTKKRYAGWAFEKTEKGWEDRLIMKGIETVRRDWCGLTASTLFDVLQILLKEQDRKKAFNYVKDMLVKLQKSDVPIEQLVVTKSISKPLREYKGMQPHIELVKKLRERSPASAPGVGDRVGFVIIKGLQLMSERAEDPAYVKEHGLKIDSKYYIESQILPPLERVFDAIGIEKSELMGLGRQMNLTDAINNSKKMKEQPLTSIDGFVCDRCNQTFRRIPLVGKCPECGGGILFYSNNTKSKLWAT